MVVDDDRQTRVAFERLIKSYGHTVKLAENGLQAVRLIEKGEKFDLVITDYNMSILNGLGLIFQLKQVKKILPSPRIWLASTMLDGNVAKKALELGAEKAIGKEKIPAELEKLVAETV